LALPETHEETAWTGIRWRIRTRTIAHLLVVAGGRPQSHARALGHDGPATVLTFRTPPSEVDAFASMGDPYFYGGWGRDVVGIVITDDTDWDEVGELVTDSYRELAPSKLVDRLDQVARPRSQPPRAENPSKTM
ncbi:MAG TPA: MmcQ/YjbR family DNA-binding protein, partial [Nocardioides sp.]|nr:MmcQ/YjbR family DNA-binding protein [Nocardioides sp.]